MVGVAMTKVKLIFNDFCRISQHKQQEAGFTELTNSETIFFSSENTFKENHKTSG